MRVITGINMYLRLREKPTQQTDTESSMIATETMPCSEKKVQKSHLSHLKRELNFNSCVWDIPAKKSPTVAFLQFIPL
jgi:hypothetical protein